MRCVLVSHFHWDREWYRTFEAFRRGWSTPSIACSTCARPIPATASCSTARRSCSRTTWRVRPDRRAELAAAVATGRLAVGPWYVQPDSLLPSGESHVRNLLESAGAVATALGPCSRVAYVPDSFGHPAQLPQLFAGFGLGPFVYWRGNGDEIDALGPRLAVGRARRQRVVAVATCPTATSTPRASRRSRRARAIGLAGAVAPAGGRGRRPRAAHERLRPHCLPDAHTADGRRAARDDDSACTVQRALLDDAARCSRPPTRRRFTGELLGGARREPLAGRVVDAHAAQAARTAPARPLLDGLGRAVGRARRARSGCPTSAPSLGVAWRTLLQNHAHDSICGCSLDHVHAQMQARFDTAAELAATTTTRVLERLAGRAGTGAPTWTDEHDLAVFNPSPRAKTGIVRVPLDAAPSVARCASIGSSSTRSASSTPGSPWTACRPGRRLGRSRPRALAPRADAVRRRVRRRDVPAFGCRACLMRAAAAAPTGSTTAARSPPTASSFGAATTAPSTSARRRAHHGLFGVEDVGDRGDSYDFDPVPGDDAGDVTAHRSVTRDAPQSGIRRLRIAARCAAGGTGGAHARARPRPVPCARARGRAVPGVPAS